MTDHLAEQEFLNTIDIDRYWLHWEDYESNTGDTINYFDNVIEARQCLRYCIKENPSVYYYLNDLETGEEISSYDPND